MARGQTGEGGPVSLAEIELGIGNWAWGDRTFWAGRGVYSDADSRAAFDVSLAHGIRLIDTAEMYGWGRAEKLLGQFIRESGASVYVATKFMPLPWRLTRRRLINALQGSLRRLGLDQVELYQIHWPVPPVPIDTWAEALADAVEQGLARQVGVSNYSASQMRRAFAVLARRGVHLAANQVEYSLLERTPERNGLLRACQELGVRLLAYSPLRQGLLTGKYAPDQPPPGIRGPRYATQLARLGPLMEVMRALGAAHGGKTPAQVALNWAIRKGTLPIPGVRDARQAEENAGALGWALTDEEVAALDAASDAVTRV
ncbi:MAG: aldo/keto reductase [Anaerolineae bacterium]